MLYGGVMNIWTAGVIHTTLHRPADVTYCCGWRLRYPAIHLKLVKDQRCYPVVIFDVGSIFKIRRSFKWCEYIHFVRWEQPDRVISERHAEISQKLCPWTTYSKIRHNSVVWELNVLRPLLTSHLTLYSLIIQATGNLRISADLPLSLVSSQLWISDFASPRRPDIEASLLKWDVNAQKAPWKSWEQNSPTPFARFGFRPNLGPWLDQRQWGEEDVQILFNFWMERWPVGKRLLRARTASHSISLRSW